MPQLATKVGGLWLFSRLDERRSYLLPRGGCHNGVVADAKSTGLGKRPAAGRNGGSGPRAAGRPARSAGALTAGTARPVPASSLAGGRIAPAVDRPRTRPAAPARPRMDARAPRRAGALSRRAGMAKSMRPTSSWAARGNGLLGRQVTRATPRIPEPVRSGGTGRSASQLPAVRQALGSTSSAVHPVVAAGGRRPAPGALTTGGCWGRALV